MALKTILRPSSVIWAMLPVFDQASFLWRHRYYALHIGRNLYVLTHVEQPVLCISIIRKTRQCGGGTDDSATPSPSAGSLSAASPKRSSMFASIIAESGIEDSFIVVSSMV